MIIDANDMILGRLASFVAKRVLLGEKVEIINCGKAVITGEERYILHRFKREKSKSIQKGPYVPRTADRFVKRSIKRMLPHKNPRGREALKRIMCYVGVPESMQDKKAQTIKEANASKVPTLRYIRVERLCKLMGGK